MTTEIIIVLTQQRNIVKVTKDFLIVFKDSMQSNSEYIFTFCLVCPQTVRQKLGMILVIKWFKNGSYQKIIFTKKSERFGQFLTKKIYFESPKLALFDKLSADGNTKFGNFI